MAKRIKECRLNSKLTQEELANKLGLKKSAIAKYENGRVENIKRNTIEEMAKIFDVKPSYIMGWDDGRNMIIEYVDLTEAEKSAQKRLLAYYKALSEIDKKRVDNYVKNLYNIQLSDKEILNAAHKRTDIDIPEGIDISENDIMDDENF